MAWILPLETKLPQCASSLVLLSGALLPVVCALSFVSRPAVSQKVLACCLPCLCACIFLVPVEACLVQHTLHVDKLNIDVPVMSSIPTAGTAVHSAKPRQQCCMASFIKHIDYHAPCSQGGHPPLCMACTIHQPDSVPAAQGLLQVRPFMHCRQKYGRCVGQS